MSRPEQQADQTETQAATGITDPPRTFWGIVARLGPGLIVAGSIVGSGELIATTKTGAQAGISLLWLIIVGCVIKVFVQVELGRYAIIHSETTLSSLNRLPGPRGARVNWVLALWWLMTLSIIGQQGGIVGGVGQAMALTFPLKGDYRRAIQVPSQKELERFLKWDEDIRNGQTELSRLSADKQARILRGHEAMQQRLNRLGPIGEQVVDDTRQGRVLADPWTIDDKVWAGVAAVLTAGLLFWGRYRSIQNVATVLVVSFTFITIANVVALQTTEQWSIPLSDYLRGLSFGAPESDGTSRPWMTALAAFGIIGVGASELIVYPYWCMEKGYARFAGIRTNDESWARRARGWLRIMHFDVLASMVVYTVATLAFFLMGVAVLHKDDLDPEGMRMVSTLAESYRPVFGPLTQWLFLMGAMSVLYSTFLVAAAGYARMIADAFKVCGFASLGNDRVHDRSVAILSVIWPLASFAICLTGANPVALVLLSGTTQAAMLPVLGFAALYFRYGQIDHRLAPGAVWDFLLILSCLGMLVAGVWGVGSRFL